MKPFYLSAVSLFISLLSIAQPSVTCDTVIQTSTCAGGNVIVPFTVTGGNFSFGNVFTAQLSDVWGQFTNPVNIGSIPWMGSGVIFANIPANANFSFFYRIRVIASNPDDTSNASPNPIVVTQVAQLNQIVAYPHDYVCPGDTITLYAINFASSYSWSTGDTTASIQITQPGIYSVTTTDPLTCQSTAYDTLYTSCTGVEENNLNEFFSLYPNPSRDHVFLRLENDRMLEAEVHFISVLGETAIGNGIYGRDKSARPSQRGVFC
jgi:hypothetical protein